MEHRKDNRSLTTFNGTMQGLTEYYADEVSPSGKIYAESRPLPK